MKRYIRLRASPSARSRSREASTCSVSASWRISSDSAESARPERLMETFKRAPWTAASRRSAADPASEAALGLPSSARSGMDSSSRPAVRAVSSGTWAARRFAAAIFASRAAFSSSVAFGRRRAATTSSKASESSRESSRSFARAEAAACGDGPHGLVRRGVFLPGERQRGDHLGESGSHGPGDRGRGAASRCRSRRGEVVQEASEGGRGKVRHAEALRTTRPPRMTAETRFTPQ